jgi:hypothetical protein
LGWPSWLGMVRRGVVVRFRAARRLTGWSGGRHFRRFGLSGHPFVQAPSLLSLVLAVMGGLLRGFGGGGGGGLGVCAGQGVAGFRGGLEAPTVGASTEPFGLGACGYGWRFRAGGGQRGAFGEPERERGLKVRVSGPGRGVAWLEHRLSLRFRTCPAHHRLPKPKNPTTRQLDLRANCHREQLGPRRPLPTSDAPPLPRLWKTSPQGCGKVAVGWG